MGGPQLDARVDGAVAGVAAIRRRAAGAGELGRDPGASEVLQRLFVERLGIVVVGQQRACPREQAETPRGPPASARSDSRASAARADSMSPLRARPRPCRRGPSCPCRAGLPRRPPARGSGPRRSGRGSARAWSAGEWARVTPSPCPRASAPAMTASATCSCLSSRPRQVTIASLRSPPPPGTTARRSRPRSPAPRRPSLSAVPRPPSSSVQPDRLRASASLTAHRGAGLPSHFRRGPGVGLEVEHLPGRVPDHALPLATAVVDLLRSCSAARRHQPTPLAVVGEAARCNRAAPGPPCSRRPSGAGVARAASATSSTVAPVVSRPAHIADSRASRYVSRASASIDVSKGDGCVDQQ